jgi:hypothetical protein
MPRECKPLLIPVAGCRPPSSHQGLRNKRPHPDRVKRISIDAGLPRPPAVNLRLERLGPGQVRPYRYSGRQAFHSRVIAADIRH